MKYGKDECERLEDDPTAEPDPTKAKYVEFYWAVEEAITASEVTVVSNWQSKTEDDWRAAQQYLARRFPKRWAAKAEPPEEPKKRPSIIEVLGAIAPVPPDTPSDDSE